VKENKLNCSTRVAFKAIEIINKYGMERGSNGMPKFLPGINIIFGLSHESRETHKFNMQALTEIYNKGWLLRRINIRQVAILPNTMMQKEIGNRYLRKNRKYYWKWRNDIRQNIDLPILKRLVPKGTIIKDVFTEIYDGNTTFARQIGTYPLIIGIMQRLPLKKFVTIKVRDHMLRSVVGEVV
jgi:radical SAM superfamily enzyme with C-terminal helix-hairpin-helix motif